MRARGAALLSGAALGLADALGVMEASGMASGLRSGQGEGAAECVGVGEGQGVGFGVLLSPQQPLNASAMTEARIRLNRVFFIRCGSPFTVNSTRAGAM